MADQLIDSFVTIYVDTPVAGTTYVGQENQQGTWLIKKVVESGNAVTISFANANNNPNVKDLTTAWNNKDTLNYSSYQDIF